ncbi:MAG TPA: DNA topoisomerase IV subunit B [Actinomycetaceae bacterium]|nr:DNA topoisomerase IV subunit B [Actinomycetaceae bacterium]
MPPKSKVSAGKASARTSDYTARSLSVLEGLEAVRKRPGMYIGTTDSRGLMHCLWEIIDNSVDEALEGHGDEIDIILHEDGSVEVRDRARGIPVDTVAGTGQSGVEVVYTKLHAGGKFGGGSYQSSGGLHGVGASVVNALSERLDVEVDRGGATWRMQFHRGLPGRFDDSSGISPTSPFVQAGKKAELEKIATVPKSRTGTRVRYWVDRQIFPSTATLQYGELLDRARQTSFLVPGLTVRVTNNLSDFVPQQVFSERAEPTAVPPGIPGADSPDEPGVPSGDPDALFVEEEAVASASVDIDPRTEEFRHDGGTVDFVDFLAPDNPVTETWHLTGTGTYTETVQQIDSKGHLRPKEIERTCKVDVALRWGAGYEFVCRSFVNIIATPKGGTHIAGFEQALLKSIRRHIEANPRRFKINARDTRIEKEDAQAGLTAVVAVSVPEPQFEGQTKEVLGTGPVRGVVSRVIEAELEEIFSSNRKATRDEASLVLEKIVGEMRSRVSARMHKEITRRKNALETSALPAKLSDCRTTDVGASELFIVEGQSALGTAKEARNSEFQALLPIRGKILNVQKASPADMLRNAECASIIQVMGAGSGRTFDVSQARYGKVILMTDADVDGAHIRTLLLTFFFKYMRPLVENGRVYAAVPPLHRIEVAGHGRRAGEMIYTYSEAELHQVLTRLQKQGRTYKSPIQRYKGLGEMDADQLAETTMDPVKRSLRRINAADEENLGRIEGVFDLLMGSDVAPRKEFIVGGASRIDREAIDA